MARTLILAAALLPLYAQQIDYSLFDRLAEKAKESAIVNLGPEQLSLLAGAKTKEGGQDLAELAKTLRGIMVRSFEFDSPCQYDPAQVRALGEKIRSSGAGVPSSASGKRKSSPRSLSARARTAGPTGC